MDQDPVIQKFNFHEKYISLDWGTLQQAIKISIPHGITNIFFEPQNIQKYTQGMWFAILPVDILEIVLQENKAEAKTNVIFKTKDKEINLGTTQDFETAQKWVSLANEIVKNAKPNSPT